MKVVLIALVALGAVSFSFGDVVSCTQSCGRFDYAPCSDVEICQHRLEMKRQCLENCKKRND